LLPVYITSLCKLVRQKILWYAAKPPENNKPLFVGCLKRAVSYFLLNHPQTSPSAMTASRLQRRRVRDLMSLPPLFLPANRKHSSFALVFGGPNFPKASKQIFVGGWTTLKIV